MQFAMPPERMMTVMSTLARVSSFAWFAFAACCLGCSDRASNGNAPTCREAIGCGSPQVPSDSGRDDADRGDVTPDGPCAEMGCACSSDPSAPNSLGIASLDCYCGCGGGACPDYATARSMCSPFEAFLDDYPACQLEVISYQTNAFEPGVQVVYDANTHALVGASYTGDTPSRSCGDRLVYGYRAGTFPPSDCARGDRKWLCRGDGGTAGARLSGSSTRKD